MDQVIGLFPTPFMRSPGLLGQRLVAELVDRFAARALQVNSSSKDLSHTELLQPDSDPMLAQIGRLVAPKLVDFGVQLFGDRLDWTIKEMWVNVQGSGGRQAMHNHANSFASGIVYLTRSHPSAQTVFLKAPGGTDFVFNHSNAKTALGPFNAGKWIGPAPEPGDLVLFPSGLLHEVPPNQGTQRITLAFNAIPHRLDSWGYTIGLSR